MMKRSLLTMQTTPTRVQTSAATPAFPTPASWAMPNAARAAIEYWLDVWQRTILTWDVLRERGNQRGIVTLCIGRGQGIALALESM
jgi:hypothetical protein